MKFGKISKTIMAAAFMSIALTGCVNSNAIIKVNDVAITQAQYDEAYKKETQNPQYQLFASMMKNSSNMLELMVKERIVNNLIVKALLEQEYTKRGIVAMPEEIAARKAEIIEKLGGEEQLQEALNKSEITEQKFEEDLAEDIKVTKLVDASGNVNVTEKEVKDFYAKNKESFNYPERVRASHILIEVNPQKIKQDIVKEDKKGELTSEDINKKTQEILDQKIKLAKEVRAKAAANPKEFAALAKQYSEDKGTASKGGDLGFFEREAMVKPFSDAAFKLKPGTVSEIVTTDFGHHIIIVVDKAKAGIQPYDKVKEEIQTFLKQQKQASILTNLLEGLKAAAKIEYVKTEYDINEIQKQMSEISQKANNASAPAQNADKKAPVNADKKAAPANGDNKASKAPANANTPANNAKAPAAPIKAEQEKAPAQTAPAKN